MSFIAGSTAEKGDRYSDGVYSGFVGLLLLLLVLVLAMLLLELGLLCARTDSLTARCMQGWQCWHVGCGAAAFDLCSSMAVLEERLRGPEHVCQHLNVPMGACGVVEGATGVCLPEVRDQVRVCATDAVSWPVQGCEHL